jgi:hypothetical protein
MIIKLFNSDEDFKIDFTKDQILKAREKAINFISLLNSSLVSGDKIKIAFKLYYESDYFLNKEIIYSIYSLEPIKYFFEI